MDVWKQQEALGRHVGAWGVASVVLGGLLAALGQLRGSRRLRAFGAQNAGWGAVDLAIVALVRRLTRRQLAELDDPYGPAAQRAQGRKLLGQLLLNAGLDLGYVWYGVRRYRRAAAGSSGRGHAAAMMLQGAFLFVADSAHAAQLRLSDAGARQTCVPRSAGRRPL